jgi:hypothetical protein
MTAATIFLLLEGAWALGSETPRPRFASVSGRVARSPVGRELTERPDPCARLPAEAIWILLEGSAGPAAPGVDRAHRPDRAA